MMSKRFDKLRWVAVLSILGALVEPSIGQASADNGADKTPKISNSLAGNYLAARIAASDRDTESAAAFYRKAISLD